MEMQELSLEKFEEASEIVKKVTQETKLIYSEYFSERYAHTGSALPRSDHSICRKPCTGRRLRRKACRR